MSIKDKLIFCGNSSIDRIVTHQGTKDIIGGSAVNAAIAGSLSGNKEISIISSIGYDFPIDALDKLSIDTRYIQKYENKTNSFNIDEINNKISLINNVYAPIIIPEQLTTDYLHISCRKGVPFIDAMNKIHAQYYSLDVMWSSIKDFLPELSTCLKKADFLFCNDNEFIIMQRNGLIDSLPQGLSIFTTDMTGVFYRKGNERKYFETIKTDVVSTVGAGDTFLGSFLSSFNGKNLNEAVYQALAMASISVQDYGNLHLRNKSIEISRAKNTIQKMDKKDETQFNIYNRSSLQR